MLKIFIWVTYKRFLPPPLNMGFRTKPGITGKANTVINALPESTAIKV